MWCFCLPKRSQKGCCFLFVSLLFVVYMKLVSTSYNGSSHPFEYGFSIRRLNFMSLSYGPTVGINSPISVHSSPSQPLRFLVVGFWNQRFTRHRSKSTKSCWSRHFDCQYSGNRDFGETRTKHASTGESSSEVFLLNVSLLFLR